MNALTEVPPPVSAKDKRARLADRLRRASEEGVPRPLSFSQQRLWFLDQLEPNSPLYNVPAVIRLTGKLDTTALDCALKAVIARHEALRSRFDCDGETPVLTVLTEARFKLMDIGGKSREEAKRWYEEEVKRPFNLSGADPLLRAALVRLEPDEHLLVLNMHHIVSDEWSLKVLFREIQQFYTARVESRQAALPPLSIQFSDYAAWQRKCLDDEALREQLRFWTEQFRGAPSMTELLTDRPRGLTPTSNGRTLSRPLAPELKGELERLGGERGSTLFMVLFAAFMAVVRRYTGADDITVATPISGRNRIETEGLIGFFVNTLLLRANLGGDPSFEEILRRVRAVALDAYAHQDLPFEKLVEALKPERSLNHLAFTRIMFALQKHASDGGGLELPGLTAEWVDVDTGTAKFDLTFVVQEVAAGLTARVEYNSDLFEQGTIERLCEHFENLLRGIVAKPEQRLSELPLLGADELIRVLTEWNNTATDYPCNQCVHELFEARASERPDAVAVVFGGESLTYGALNARANQLAHYLRAQNLKPGTPAAICLDRSIQMVIGLLAILKAGCAYVPLDPAYPKERLAFMLDDTRTPVVLTKQSLLRHFPHRGVKSICLDTDSGLIASQAMENPVNHSVPEDVAYIIYTSGSTGQPKGVAVPHRAVNRLVFNTNYIQLDATDRIAQVSNMSFDAATFEIWGALLKGGELRVITTDVALSPREFAGELREQGITAMFLTSALFSHLAIELPGIFSTLRTLIAGGEALEPKAVRAVLQDRPPRRLVNGYGPTENTTFTCCALLRDVPDDATSVPIGRPISNTHVYILDEYRNPVPIGVAGELYTGGDGLARGYWNRPELTGEKFVLHQFTPDGPCQYLYRTGDMARYLPDGAIEFLGRKDDQIKIRGFRVELGEIEAALAKHSGVRECAVKSLGARAGETRLVAYFTSASKRHLKTNQLRAFLEERLPEYMVPSTFVQMEALPLTRNGKIDRHGLPEPDYGRPETGKKYASPRDAVELELTKIWESVLGVEPIGIEDRFFDLGGHSLLAVRVVARIEKAFGKKLPLVAIFMSPTIEKLAAHIRDEMRGDSIAPDTSVVALQPKGARPPIFFVHGAGGGMFWGYVNLARRLGSDQPAYGLSSRGVDGRVEFATIEEMAAQYVNDLRAVQPRGPYYLGGYCFGGNVAYEMARQLDAQGEKVALLALLNCAPPNSRYLRPQWTFAWFGRLFRNLLYWLDYCSQWTHTQRRDFVRWKWTRLKQWLKGAPEATPDGEASVDADALIDLSSLPEQQRGLWRTHIRALMNFHPQTYSGRVHLFRSPGHPLWCSFESDYGWGELARDGVTVSIVKGAHEKILEEPWVDETAAVLKKALEETREGDLEFWKRELAGAPALLELPGGRPRPAVRAKKIGTESRRLSNVLADRLKDMDSDLLTLAAFEIVLHRYTGQEDILVGLQTAECDSPSNIVVLRARLNGNLTGHALLNRIRAARTSALQHGELPFVKLVAELCPAPDPAFHPLVQFFFTCGSAPAPDSCDMRLALISDGETTTLRLEYADDLFGREAMERMLGHMETALSCLVNDPEKPLSALSILTPAESDLILGEWTRTEKEFPSGKTLIELFEEQAARTPEAEALICGSKRLTYRELCLRSRRVARRLRDFGVGVGVNGRVGICLERSENMVAGILGTLQAGGAYVPLDPAYPKARLEFIAKDAGLCVLLTQRGLRGLVEAGDTPVLCVEDITGEGEDAITGSASPGDLAYVLYTSGSTGQPKGVALENRSAVAFISWAGDVFTQEELSGVLASTSICFDLSVFELFVPLCWGGKVILAENALALPSLCAANEVTLINTVPSAIRELLRINGVPPSVRVVNLAGEPLPAAVVDQIYNDTSVVKVYDLYGPTETTTYSTFTLRKAGEAATIGRPLANEQVYILDKCLQPMPIGVPGDLYIGGAGLARCYLNRPELTAERFLVNPFRLGERLYKTGDVALWREDGNLVYLGRSDHQVKVRGFRIELGEIEMALKSHRSIADAIVVVREDRPGDKRLAAYVVSRPGQQPTAEELRGSVAQKLPQYMTPVYFVFLPQLPLTPNGKVDRHALPAPQTEHEHNDNFEAPLEGLEAQIAAIWAEVLGSKKVGATENFLELGGNSLLAIQVVLRIRSTLSVDLPLSCLFEATTVRELAGGIAEGRWKQDGATVPALVPISRKGALPASFMQEQLWILHQLDPGSDAYNVPVGIRLRGPLDLNILRQSLNKIVRRHEALRTTLKSSNGNLTQIVKTSLEIDVPLTDFRGEDGLRVDEFLLAEAQRPFDLERGPLIRAAVARVSDEDHAVIIVMHHAVTDGWSLDVLFRELGANYEAFTANGTGREWPNAAVQFADFAAWQRSWMQGKRLDDELSHWKQKLAGAPLAVNLPTDFPAMERSIKKVGRNSIDLPGRLCGELTQLGRNEGATAFMVLMAALAITLRKWTGQTDMVLGTVVAGRIRREVESLVGCFMNFLPLRFRIDASQSYLEVLRAVKTEVIAGQAHQDCPFEKIVASRAGERVPNRNPIYNVALLFQNSPEAPRFGGRLECAPIDVHTNSALLDLRFEANETQNGMTLACEFNAGLFNAQTIEHLLRSIQGELENLSQNAGNKIIDAALNPALAIRAGTQTETIVISSTFTAEPVEAPLRYWLDELEIPCRVKFAPYNQVYQQLLDPAGDMAANKCGLNVLLIRLQDWQSASQRHDFTNALQSSVERGGVPILICFCPAPRALTQDAAKARELDQAEKEIERELAEYQSVHIVRAGELTSMYPVLDYDDPAAEELGNIPYSPAFFTALATMIARRFHALRQTAYKVIALDCDETLWSGRCGEDGPNGIRLDAPRVALQQFMRRQKDMGKLLVICSKNDDADVSAVFDTQESMPLKSEDFAAKRVNWQPKSENLKSIARELNLGLESFVFIDDNPVECAEVEAHSPEALVLQLPQDTAQIPQFLEHCWAFDQLKTTDEDETRTELYRQNRLREEFQSQTVTFADFIAGLNLDVQIAPAESGQYSRIAQLTQRTNQFNVSGKRRSEIELRRLPKGHTLWAVSAKDRFGDYGLVGVVIFEVKEKTVRVDTFLLSCRALGKGVEHRMLAELGKYAAKTGAQWVDIPFVRLPRNEPALDFLESVGASHKQSRGGSLCFHLPAKITAEVAFSAARAADIPQPGSAKEDAHTRRKSEKFTKCQVIALETADILRLHEKIESLGALRPASRDSTAEPRTELERKLCDLWQRLLRLERVGIEDDFFELGGHSLLAVRLFAEIEKMTGKKMPLVTIFQAPTILQLASKFEAEPDSESESILVPIQPHGSKPPLYLVHGAGGDVLWGYANLVEYMPHDQPIYAIKSESQNRNNGFQRLEDMAARYLQAVRAHQPEGPYYLGGYCFGGNVAYEMARQLKASGEEVALLALLDTAPVNAGYETICWWRPEFPGLFARNLYYWAQDFAALESRDRRRFMERKVRTLGRKLGAWLRRNSRRTEVDLEQVIDPSHFSERELKLWRIHLRALESHVQQPYPGHVTLFRTRGHPLLSSFAPDLRWSSLVADGVTVNLIPGSHENIFMEPHVQSLAHELTRSLSETQQTLLQHDLA